MRIAVCSSVVAFSTFLAASALAQAPAAQPGAAPPPGSPPPGAPPPGAPPPAYGPPPPGYYYGPPPVSDEVRYPSKSAGIYINPLAFLLGFFGAEADFKLANMVTLNVGLNYYHRSITILDSTESNTAYGGDLGAQIFPLGRAFNQLYVYPRVSFLSYTATSSTPGNPDESATAKLLGVGATVGYQWTYTGGFSLRLGGGVMYYSAAAKDNNNNLSISIDGVLPALDASLGWTF